MSNDDSAATRSRLDALLLTGRAGSAILQRAVLSGRLTAGCPSGQRERSVKPSAQPTLVRTQHLPPPAKTAPDQCFCRRGLRLLVSGCVRLRPAVYGWPRRIPGEVPAPYDGPLRSALVSGGDGTGRAAGCHGPAHFAPGQDWSLAVSVLGMP